MHTVHSKEHRSASVVDATPTSSTVTPSWSSFSTLHPEPACLCCFPQVAHRRRPFSFHFFIFEDGVKAVFSEAEAVVVGLKRLHNHPWHPRPTISTYLHESARPLLAFQAKVRGFHAGKNYMARSAQRDRRGMYNLTRARNALDAGCGRRPSANRFSARVRAWCPAGAAGADCFR